MNRSVYIGWDPREIDAWEVARYSLLRRCSRPIQVHKLRLSEMQERGLYTRPTKRVGNRLVDELSIRPDYDGSISTEHANSRFLTPHLARTGWALFMDGDMLVRGDIADVFEGLNPAHAVYCVKHLHRPRNITKMDDQLQTRYRRKNWSSFMIFNCDHPANKALTLEKINKWPGRELHAFSWLVDWQIGELLPDWNYLVGYSDPEIQPKVVHFTEGTPDMAGYEHCEYAEEWREELRRARELQSRSNHTAAANTATVSS